jgi:hypothetical protein
MDNILIYSARLPERAAPFDNGRHPKPYTNADIGRLHSITVSAVASGVGRTRRPTRQGSVTLSLRCQRDAPKPVFQRQMRSAGGHWQTRHLVRLPQQGRRGVATCDRSKQPSSAAAIR